MATQLFFQSTAVDYSRGQGDADQQGTTQNWSPLALATTRGGAAVSATRTSIAGAVTGLTAGTNLEWISEPLDADITISGTVTFNLWGNQAANANNTGLGCIVQRLDSQGAIVSTIVDNPEIGVELPNTTPAVRNETASPTSTNMLKGDRLRIRVYFNDAAGVTMGSGGALVFRYAGTTAAVNGDSYVTFTENFGFLTTAPSGSVLYLTDTAAEVDPNGATYDAKEAWTSRGAGVTTYGTTPVAGPTAPRLMTAAVGGNFLEWFTKGVTAFTLDGLIACNICTWETVVAGNAASRCEVAVTAADGTSPVVWGAANDGVELGTAEAAMTWSVAGDATAITDGQRLRIRIYIDDAPGVAMGASGTMYVRYAGTSAAASGDTYITLPQTVTEYAPSGDESVSPATVAAIAAVPAPTINAQGVHAATTAAAVGAVPAPTLSSNQTATAVAVAGVGSAPAPTLQATAIAASTAVAGVAALDTPTILTAGDATVTAATVEAIGAVLAPTSIGGPAAIAQGPLIFFWTEAGAAGEDETTTPATVAGTASNPAPSVLAAAEAEPSTIAAVGAAPAPTVQATAIIQPVAVAAVGAVVPPTVTAGGDISVGGTTVVAAVAVPAPTVTGTARVTAIAVPTVASAPAPAFSSSRTVEPTTVAGTASTPAPTVQGTAIVTPTTVGTIGAVPAPSVLAGGSTSVGASTVIAVADVPATTVRGTAITTGSAGAVSAVGAPSFRSDQTATGNAAATGSVLAPTVSGTAIVAPSTVGAVASVPTVAVLIGGNATANPATVAAVAALPSSTVSGQARITATAVAGVASVPASTRSSSQTATPSSVAATAAAPAPTLRGSAIALQTTVAAAGAVPPPSVTAGGSISVGASTVSAIAAVPAPSTLAAGVVSPGHVAVLTALPAPTLRGTAQVSPSVVIAVVTVPAPIIFGGTIGFPVPGPTYKRVLVGVSNAEVQQGPNGGTMDQENDTDVLVGVSRTVLVGAGRNGMEDA